MHTTIYKIVTDAAWREAERAGVFRGAAIDLQDGYIHFSTAGQVERLRRATSPVRPISPGRCRHGKLGDALKYEPSRGGALFPHLYAPLDLSAVRWVKPLPLGPSGRHLFPGLE